MTKTSDQLKNMTQKITSKLLEQNIKHGLDSNFSVRFGMVVDGERHDLVILKMVLLLDYLSKEKRRLCKMDIVWFIPIALAVVLFGFCYYDHLKDKKQNEIIGVN